MKRFLTAAVSMLAIVALCVCMAGCATDVKGKTYIYDKAELNTEKELSSVEQAAAEFALALLDESLAGTEIVFSADSDTVTINKVPGKYTQEGEKVTFSGITGLTSSEAIASGNTLTMSGEQGGYTFKLIYKIK
ncbi:MAG: hypothetical protein K2N30_05900 [Clostridia bacterium]|nr:hypothetical protein [Clostridia bacterium]